MTTTGVERLTCCQPLAVSLVKVAVASKCAGRAPQIRHMRAGVLRTFVESDPRDRPGRGGLELDAEFHRIGIVLRDRGRRIASEQTLPRIDRERDVGRRGALSVGGRIGEGGRPDVTGRGHETDRLRARVVGDRAVARIAHPCDRQRQPIGVRVVGEQCRSRDRQCGVRNSNEPAVIIGHRRLPRIDHERDVSRRCALSVGDRIGEAGRPDVTGRGHETDRLRARVVSGRAVARIAHPCDRQRQPIGVRVVGEQCRSRDRQCGVRNSNEPAVIIGHRRLQLQRRSVEDDIHPVVAGNGVGRKEIGTAVRKDAVAAARPAGERRQ